MVSTTLNASHHLLWQERGGGEGGLYSCFCGCSSLLVFGFDDDGADDAHTLLAEGKGLSIYIGR